MGLLPLEKRQNCASGFSWYVCSNGPGFRGCCSVDPCTAGICPTANQGTNLDGTSITSRTSTPTSRTSIPPTSLTSTLRTTTISSTPSIINTPTVTATIVAPIDTPITTPSPTGSDVMDTAQDTFTIVTGGITTTVRGSDNIVIETTGGRTITIPLNIDSTATVTGSPTSTGIAGASESSGSGNNMGVIIGAAVGGVIFLILLVAAFFFIRRRRRNHSASSPYGAVSDSSGFSGFFPKKHANNSNVNSMESPDNANPAKAGFFGFFKKRNEDTDSNYRDDTKVPGIPGPLSPPQGFTEMPAQSFVPPHQGIGLPYNMVELDSVVSAPSELSAVSTPLYHTTRTSSSAWSPTPELPSEVSGSSSTGAVLSPTRDTHYSEASTAGSPRPGQYSQTQSQQNSNLRGGGWPGTRENLNSPGRKPIRGPTPLAPPPPLPDPNTHVLSWMDYNRGPGSSGNGGAIR